MNKFTEGGNAPDKEFYERSEVGQLLDLVEKIQKDLRENSRKLSNSTALLNGLYWLVIISAFLLVKELDPKALSLQALSSPSEQLTLFLVFIAATAVAEIGKQLLRGAMGLDSLKRQIYMDRRAMGEVLELLREIEHAVAKQEEWSALNRAWFRLSVSRYETDAYGELATGDLTLSALFGWIIAAFVGRSSQTSNSREKSWKN
ncbi:hypothetical protein [Gloeobacter violaceus]|uniref:hypothetical protein n=1 Tax=Gloeobacter violaceus TaxID=33072 RepID=UPI0013E8D22B|nr:hypothetical protein [Gloeobacter violaceus]